MSRAKDKIAIRVDARPVERHKAAFISKSVQIVGEVCFVILAPQLAGCGHDKRRLETVSRFSHDAIYRGGDISIVMLLVILGYPTTPRATRLDAKYSLQVALVRLPHI